MPERPSTPSAQFVTLIEPHTKITASTPYTMGGNAITCPVSAIVTSLPLKFTTVIAVITAIKRSKSPLRNSPQDTFAQSSRYPVIIAETVKIK